jgi:hypothetical protein
MTKHKIYLKNYNTADLIQQSDRIHALDLSTNESLSFSLDALIAKVGDKKIVSMKATRNGRVLPTAEMIQRD